MLEYELGPSIAIEKSTKQGDTFVNFEKVGSSLGDVYFREIQCYQWGNDSSHIFSTPKYSCLSSSDSKGEFMPEHRERKQAGRIIPTFD